MVLTKYDLFGEKCNPTDNANEKRLLDMKDFKNVERSIAEVFSLKGNLNANTIRWVNYTDEQSDDNPSIDNIALKFLKKNLIHSARDTQNTHTRDVQVIMYTRLQIHARQLKNYAGEMFWLFIIIVAILALFLWRQFIV